MICVVTPWVTDVEVSAFKDAWQIGAIPDWLVLQQDKTREGCGVTKNKGVREALRRGAEIVVVLDGDCYPSGEARTLDDLIERHVSALEPQSVEMFETVTGPPSRGTPYKEIKMTMPVAASMGFWTEIGDYCSVRQLAYNAAPMTFRRERIHGRYFPLCGMNLAFRPAEWLPWCQFIDVPRFDDIWMGWLWQKEAYRRGYCFNLAGPLIRHARQSNVWKNLRDEAVYLERSETLWRDIASATTSDYDDLCSLLPVYSSFSMKYSPTHEDRADRAGAEPGGTNGSPVDGSAGSKISHDVGPDRR